MMHSHYTGIEAQNDPDFAVLILVVMDDALART